MHVTKVVVFSEYKCWYFSATMGVPGKTQGTMFTLVPLELMYHEPERVGGSLTIVVFITFFIIVTFFIVLRILTINLIFN